MHLILDVHRYIFSQCDAKTQYSYLFVSKDVLKIVSNILKSKCISLNEITSYLVDENSKRFCIFVGDLELGYINSCEMFTNKITDPDSYIRLFYEFECLSNLEQKYTIHEIEKKYGTTSEVSTFISCYDGYVQEVHLDIFAVFHILRRRQSVKEYAKTYCINYVSNYISNFSRLCSEYKNKLDDPCILDIAYFLYFQLNILNINGMYGKELNEMYFEVEIVNYDPRYYECLQNDHNAKTLSKIINLIEKMSQILLTWCQNL